MVDRPNIPYDWIEHVDPQVLTLDEIPLFGWHASFPWEEFSQLFSKGFGGSSISFSTTGGRWIEGDNVTDDFGDDVHIQTVSLSGYAEKVTFIMSQADLTFLLLTLLNKEAPHELSFFDEELLEGFHRFFSLELIRAFTSCNFEKTLSPHLHKENPLPGPPVYGLQIRIHLNERDLSAKLLIPKSFQEEWKKKHSDSTLRAQISHRLLDETTVTLALEAGKSLLTQKEIKTLKTGDLLLLDQCYVDPDSGEGHLLITLKGTPRLRGTLKKGQIEIKENGIYSEELTKLLKRDAAVALRRKKTR